jgi:hypothetical protein
MKLASTDHDHAPGGASCAEAGGPGAGTRASSGTHALRATLTGSMFVIRRRLSWFIAAWLACQAAILAGSPALAAMGLDQDPCCQGLAPGQTCPMHQSPAGDRPCKMRSECRRADFELLSILSGLGILPDLTNAVTVFVSGEPVARSDAFRSPRSSPPDAPPPRS